MSVTYSTVILAAAIGVLPVVGWMIFMIREYHITYEKSDFLLKVFFWGVLTAIPASLLEIYLIESGGDNRLFVVARDLWIDKSSALLIGTILSASAVAAIEELSKGCAVFFGIIKSKLSSITDGLVIGMLVGLAFGVTENGVYFASAVSSEAGSELIMIVVLRFLLSTSAHIIYSGGMGILLAEAVAAENMFTKIMKWLIALVVPISIHTIFNFTLNTKYSWFSVFIIVIGFVMLWRRYVFVKKFEENSAAKIAY